MQIKILDKKEDLALCPWVAIDHLLWGTKSIPSTRAKIGFLPGTGFLVKMTCMEKDPQRNHTKPNSMVYRDSAMETFLMIGGEGSVYLNLEMNANGAVLGQLGKERLGRTPLTLEQIESCHCKAEVLKDCWSVEVTIPLSLLEELTDNTDLKAGSQVSLNFYKISEDPAIEHYASYSMIDSEMPNFHLPEFFEPSKLSK